MKDYELEKIAQNLVDNVQELTADNIYSWLVDNEWRIYSHREKEYHREDILNELQNRNERYVEECEEKGIEPNPKHIIDATDDLVDTILYNYEDRLGDSGEWHDILDYVLDDMELGALDDDDED